MKNIYFIQLNRLLILTICIGMFQLSCLVSSGLSQIKKKKKVFM